MSQLTGKEKLTEFEVKKLQRLTDLLIKETERKSLEIQRLRRNQFRYFNEEECWIWQGDGSDNLESLVCPVVISPKSLIELIGK